jgi:4-hydroxy-2-oxoheptanedioate aldolase
LNTSHPLRRLWAENRCAIGAWCLSPDPVAAEVLARAGFDWICIDLQHGWLGIEEMIPVVHSIATAGSVPIVRVPANELWLIGRALDAGAYGVLVPLVNSADEAERAVRACRYPKAGSRSVGAFRRAPSIASDAAHANSEVLCIVMIESASALEDIDSICALPGVDAVYIGPGDLALSLGLSHRQEHDLNTFRAISEAAHRHKKAAGMHGETGEEAGWAIENGFDLTTAGADVDFMYGAACAALATASASTAKQTSPSESIPQVPL